MSRPSWDDTWLSVADAVSKRSRCSRAQIGAVIVDKNKRVCATGYNGPAASWPHNSECILWCPRAAGTAPLDTVYDMCPAIHAEANALLYVDRTQIENGTIYITSSVCMQCAKLISNSGIVRVVMRVNSADTHRKPEETIDYLQKCGIIVDARYE